MPVTAVFVYADDIIECPCRALGESGRRIPASRSFNCPSSCQASDRRIM